ncbi:MAG TPA: hypothetical protein VFV41_09325 [Streptosporangiaceae bacterium]|nr:hypothetical protein [Streptosporangiaceae bacterium]
MKFAIRNMHSGWEGRSSMKYVSVLTPPLLVCAAFLVAVAAFLRHEMGARRQRSEDVPREDISAAEQIHGDDADTQAEDAAAAERGDHK